jgi:hypothetical protein
LPHPEWSYVSTDPTHTVQKHGRKKTEDRQIRASPGGSSRNADIQAAEPNNRETPSSNQWDYPNSPGNRSPKDNVPTPTERTPKLPSLAFDGKDDCAFFVSAVNIVVANQTKTVVQKTRGHASPFVTGNPQQISFWGVCPFFSTAKSTHQPDEPQYWGR